MVDTHVDHAAEVADLVGKLAAAHRPDPLTESDALWNPQLWAELDNLGLSHIGISETAGGSGGSWRDAFAAARALGRSAAAVPYIETGLLASWLLAESGLPLLAGPLTVVTESAATGTVDKSSQTLVVESASTSSAPWASVATHLVGLCSTAEGPVVYVVPTDRLNVAPGTNLAGEPRDAVQLDRVEATSFAPCPRADIVDELRQRSALARAALMIGASERALELTITQARERSQFGRPIGSFQAIQHHLALMAEECALASNAVETAVSALDARADELAFVVAAAKIMAGHAATTVAARAHQVHGAIGLTTEFELQRLTRRLWSWRDEAGTESDWSTVAGSIVSAHGADGFWSLLTSLDNFTTAP